MLFLVGGHDVAARRVELERQLVAVAEARPFVAPVARHRHQPVPVGADRREAARNPADVAAGVRIDLVLARRAPAVHGGAELVPVARAHVVHRSEIRRHAGLEPGRAQGPGALPAGFGHQHRAVPREAVDQLARRGLALDLDALGHAQHRLPAALVAVLGGVGRVELVHVQVLLVHVEAREAEGDGAVVADGEPGQEGLARADGVHARRAQVRHVAQARRAVGAVRIVGEDRAAGGAEPRRDHPVVAAVGGGGVAGLGLQRCRGVAVRLRRHRDGEWRVRLGELRRCGGQLVGRAQFRMRHGAGVEPRRHGGRDRRIEFAPQPVGLRARGAGAEGAGALDLGGEVEREAVVPDAHDVLGRPDRRLVAEQRELGRQQRGLRAHLRHVGVDAGREGLGHALGVGAVGQPLAVHVAAVEHGARGAVVLNPGGPEVLRHLAEPALAPQVHLPEAVARGDEALRHEGVVERARVEVRHAEAVHQHLGRLLEAGHGERRRRARRRLRAGGRRGAAREHERCERDRADGMPWTDGRAPRCGARLACRSHALCLLPNGWRRTVSRFAGRWGAMRDDL
ncbi:hypothetical protein M2165_003635 [Variovorax sp. TBS-050B]|nr:hypothetical protein [Variovorax sp. TBS-050B]